MKANNNIIRNANRAIKIISMSYDLIKIVSPKVFQLAEW